MDVVASLYDRNNLHEIVERVASQVFIPMTVGGGIRSVEDVSTLLACGADKVALNTAATRDPELITAIADLYGSQATVVSIETIRGNGGRWQVMTDNGRNHTGRDALEWAREAEDRGAGEIVVTTIHTEGLGHGYDLEMIEKVVDIVVYRSPWRPWHDQTPQRFVRKQGYLRRPLRNYCRCSLYDLRSPCG